MSEGAPPVLARLDLDAYLRRIEYAGDLVPSRRTLDELHAAHVTHIVFENLDVLLGVPIRLDIGSIEKKLVADHRGGYCFEQNALFHAALSALGFTVTRLAARVRLGTTAVLPRTHMTLMVDVDRQRMLADVGFGAEGPLLPVPIADGALSEQSPRRYRVVDERGLWVLQSWVAGEWRDLYAFTLEPQYPVDYELANYYTSTHPASRFVQTLTAQRIAHDVRRLLRDREYSEDRGTSVARRTIADDDELLRVLADEFGLRFAPQTRFRYRR